MQDPPLMNLLVISIIFAPLLSLLKMPVLLADLGMSAQHVCLSFLPASTHAEIYAGLVCGKSLGQKTLLLRLLETSQLIHLIVVSGSHLVLLHSACEFFSKKIFGKQLPSHISFAGLLLYTLMTGFQPPCVRAFLFFVAQRSRFRNHAFLSSILLTLFLIPAWIFSASFQLSVMASLFLLLVPQKKAFLTQTLLTLGLGPLLGFISLAGLLLNLIIAPVLSLFLFPLALLGILIHPFVILFDHSLNMLEMILQRLPLGNTQITFPHWSIFVFYTALIFSFFHIFYARRKQAQVWHASSSSS